jgi:voltage-gated potassium channel
VGESAAAVASQAGVSSAERAARLERVLAVPMLFASLLVVPIVVIEESSVSGTWRSVGNALNWLVWLAFAGEVVLMLAVQPRRVEWLRSHPLELAIVILTPPFLPASLAALRLFRLLRLLRLAIVVKELNRLLSPDGVRLAAVLAGASALGGGAIFADVEHGYSMWDGVWWAVTTMATVGYGDLSPKTVIGRLVGVTLMLIGVGFFALLTGAIAQRFLVDEVREIEQAEHESIAGEVDARGQVLQEIRALSTRLQQLEQAVEKL